MKTLRRYLWTEIATATGFMLFALLALFTFFDLVAQLDEIGQRGYRLRHAFAYVAFTLPSRTYEAHADRGADRHDLRPVEARSELRVHDHARLRHEHAAPDDGLAASAWLLVALTFAAGRVRLAAGRTARAADAAARHAAGRSACATSVRAPGCASDREGRRAAPSALLASSTCVRSRPTSHARLAHRCRVRSRLPAALDRHRQNPAATPSPNVARLEADRRR